MITMYHCTTPEAATAILAGGFIAREHRVCGVGVWFSPHPFIYGLDGRTSVIEVVFDATEEEFRQYAVIEDESLDPETGEWVKDEAFEACKWLFPEDVANQGARRLLTNEEAQDLV